MFELKDSTATRKIAVSVTEAAEMLGVSRPIMYEILNRADCNADFKLGARRLVSVEALRDWVEKQIKKEP